MKVHQILAEADTPRIARAGPGWKVIFPDGTEQLATSQNAANEIAKNWSTQNAVSAADDLARRTDNLGRVEPKFDVDAPASTGAKPDALSNVDLRADAPPNTPTSDSLTRSEQRRLDRTGKITRGGEVFTRANIAAMDAEVARSARIDRKLPGVTRPTAPSDAPDTNVKSKILSNLNGGWKNTLVRFFKGLLSAKAMVTLTTAFNAMVLEDVLDAYLRAIKDHGASLNNASKAEQDQYIQMLTTGDISRMPNSIKIAYLNAIEQSTKVFVEAFITLILSLGWAAIVALTAFGVSTGGLGILASIAAGGAFIIGGTALVNKILDETGVNDAIENWVGGELLSPMVIFNAAQGVDGWQEFLAAGADVGTSWLTGDTVGNLIRDDINEEQTAPADYKVDPVAVEEKLKALVKSSPKLMQAYKDGKEEAKAEMRSTTAAS
jgi:hypothetical protein